MNGDETKTHITKSNAIDAFMSKLAGRIIETRTEMEREALELKGSIGRSEQMRQCNICPFNNENNTTKNNKKRRKSRKGLGATLKKEWERLKKLEKLDPDEERLREMVGSALYLIGDDD